MVILKVPSYIHLPYIDFESLADRELICHLGLEQQEAGEVTMEAHRLGKLYSVQIEAAYIPQVSVRWINEKVEFGLFAEEDLEKGVYVGEYTGIVRRNDRRYCEPLNNYCYTYPVLDEIGRNLVIDATQGNLTRFINHSFHPNLQPMHVFHKEFYHLIFLTLDAIEKGAQLFYNYGESYWRLREVPAMLGY